MHLEWWTIALQTVNFAVLVWLLHRFLYKPVLRMIDARRAEIDKERADVAKAEADAKAGLATVERERAGIEAEKEAALKAASAQAEAAAKARGVQAEADAQALLAEARKTLAVERGQALEEMRRATLDLGANVARRLLADMPAQLRVETWLERIERHISGLSEAERTALMNQIADGASIKVVTAEAFPEKLRDIWRGKLRADFGNAADVTFDVDASLVAGVELHFPSSILRFSWRSVLDTMRAELEGNGNAH